MILEFEIKVLWTECLLEPINRLARLGQLVLLDPLRDFAGQAAGKRDQPVLVGRKQFFINARLVVITLQMRRRGEPNQVAVPRLVLGQQHQVMIDIAPAAAGLFLQSAARGHIHFATDDRLDAFLLGRLVKINRAIKHSVVGDRQRRQLQLMGPIHQPVQPTSAIEQGILGVQMQMNKVRVRHRH